MMKQDIRNLFKDEAVSEKQLPEHHRQEFYTKLKASRPRRTSKLNTNYLFKIAAIVILFLMLTLVLFNRTETVTNQVVEESPIELQIDALEKQYLASIDKEWQNFVALAHDEDLVNRYKKKLEDLDQDYQDISEQFKVNNTNVLIIEALVENLQTRLKLLKDIQEHIKLLHQKNEQYETINI